MSSLPSYLLPTPYCPWSKNLHLEQIFSIWIFLIMWRKKWLQITKILHHVRKLLVVWINFHVDQWQIAIHTKFWFTWQMYNVRGLFLVFAFLTENPFWHDFSDFCLEEKLWCLLFCTHSDICKSINYLTFHQVINWWDICSRWRFLLHGQCMGCRQQTWCNGRHIKKQLIPDCLPSPSLVC